MPAPQTALALVRLTKVSTEDYVYGVDFTRILKPGESLDPTKVPAIASSPAGLTIGTAAVNTSTFLNDFGQPVASNAGVLVEIQSGAMGQVYELIVTAQLNTGYRRAGVCQLFLER